MGFKQETVQDDRPPGALRRDERDPYWHAIAGPLAQSVYHELRHSLTAILAYSEFLAREDLGSAERKDFHQEIRLAVNQMTDLISSLLEVSKGADVRRRRLAGIASTIARGIRTVTVRPEFRCIAVRYEHTGVAGGRFDPAGLQQVITNLVLNACEAVSPDSGKIEIRSVGREDSVEIIVSDDGPGIPGPVRQRVFQPFVSYDKDGGTGLGLAIARKILRDHQGEIWLADTGRAGTVFKLYLPFYGAEADSSVLSNGHAASLTQASRLGAEITWTEQAATLGIKVRCRNKARAGLKFKPAPQMATT